MPKLRHSICVCVNCGTEFTEQTLQVEQGGRGKYCSNTCKAESTGYGEAILSAMPGTIQAISARTGFTETTVLRRIKSMRASSLCHVSQVIKAPTEWDKNKPDFTLCYDRGPGLLDDVPLDARAALTYFYRLMVLASLPAHRTKVEEITGLSTNAVVRIIREAHADGECHIKRWKRSKQNQHWMAVFAVGKGRDAPKPKAEPLSNAERCRAYIERLQKSGKIVDYRAREAARSRARKRQKNGDPLFNALFGTPAQRKQKAVQSQGANDE